MCVASFILPSKSVFPNLHPPRMTQSCNKGTKTLNWVMSADSAFVQTSDLEGVSTES